MNGFYFIISAVGAMLLASCALVSNESFSKLNPGATSANQSTQYTASLMGGANWVTYGDGGPATSVQLNHVYGVAVDGSGNVYFSESLNNVIRKIDGAGKVWVVAGTGNTGYGGDGGAATGATLSNPQGIALDGSGNLYIADAGNNAIRKVDASGVITTFAGGAKGYSGDGGPATLAELRAPCSVAIDSSGNVYFVDVGNYVIRKVDTSGTITTVAGNGTSGSSGDSGPATAAQLSPQAVAVDNTSGNLYITQSCKLRMVSGGIITTIAGDNTCWGLGDGGLASSASLDGSLYGLMVDSSGNIYFSSEDVGNIRKIDAATGIISRIAGTGTQGYSGDGGAATSAKICPYQIAMDGSGNIYIGDGPNNRIRKINTLGIISTIGGAGYIQTPSGTAATETFLDPYALTTDSSDNLYVRSGAYNTVLKIDTTGIATIVVGNGTSGHTGDGGGATSAAVSNPYGIALDSTGDLYLMDSCAIRRVASGIIDLFAGTYTCGYSGDGGAATSAEIYNYLGGVALDSSGNVYIGDYMNYRIRMVSLAGVITTLAGTGTIGFPVGDGGPATSANVIPYSLAVGRSGNVYFVDPMSSSVRRIDATTQIVTSVVGSGTDGYSGDGGSATSAKIYPFSYIAVDSQENIYLADPQYHVVRMVTASTGIITTIAGTGTAGYNGTGGNGNTIQLNSPQGIVVDSNDVVYVSDNGNHIIRKFVPPK